MLNIPTLFTSLHFRKSDLFRPIELVFSDRPAPISMPAYMYVIIFTQLRHVSYICYNANDHT